MSCKGRAAVFVVGLGSRDDGSSNGGALLLRVESMKQVETFKAKAVLANVPRAIDFVTRSARVVGFDEEALYQIQLAVDEACANVVDHAYASMEAGDMEVSCSLDGRAFIVRVRDWGRGFNPDGVPEPDVDAPLEERNSGGLGLFLVKQVMDHVCFSFDPEQGNELMMAKRLRVTE